MMLLLVFVAISVVTGSIFADYKWRRWIAAQKPRRAWPYEPPVARVSDAVECLEGISEAQDFGHRRDCA